MGQKQTSVHVRVMSALPPKADIGTQPRNVCFVPKADSCTAAILSLFDHLVGDREHGWRYHNVERFGSFHIDNELKLGWLDYRQVSDFFTLENAANIGAH